MELILWRHAEAEEGSNDLARVLTRRGQQQAGQMAAWLRPRLPENCRILVSQAKRSQQTAALLSKSYEILPAINPDATPEAVLSAIGWPESERPVLLVGHQPYIGKVVAQLLCGEAQMWPVKKDAVWWLQHRVRHGSAQTVLKGVMSAGLLEPRR